MCYLLRNTFWNELFQITRPDDTEVDLFKLLKVRDCGVYTSYFFPCGIHGLILKNLKSKHLGWESSDQSKHFGIKENY